MRDHLIKIAIVEDEVLIAEIIKTHLEDFDYEITAVFYTYETAIQGIENTEFDLVITDINLGYGTDIKSGLRLVEKLKEIKKCPFIFLTAFSDIATVKAASILKPSAYLVKPINAANLYASIQVAMENYNNATTATIDDVKKEAPLYFFTKIANKKVKIMWEDVYHMESIKNYVRLKTEEYSSGFLIRCSLNQLFQLMLPKSLKNNFIRINRAEAVHNDTIIKYDNEFVETKYGKFNLTIEI